VCGVVWETCLGDPERFPDPPRDGLRRAKIHPTQADLRGDPGPGSVHAIDPKVTAAVPGGAGWKRA
jgi:hypothetical protein